MRLERGEVVVGARISCRSRRVEDPFACRKSLLCRSGWSRSLLQQTEDAGLKWERVNGPKAGRRADRKSYHSLSCVKGGCNEAGNGCRHHLCFNQSDGIARGLNRTWHAILGSAGTVWSVQETVSNNCVTVYVRRYAGRKIRQPHGTLAAWHFWF